MATPFEGICLFVFRAMAVDIIARLAITVIIVRFIIFNFVINTNRASRSG